MRVLARKPVLDTISDRQFFEGLWRRDRITFEEYIAAVGPGTLPASLLLLIGVLPVSDVERQSALGLLTGATTFSLSHPFTPMIGQLYGWDAADLEDFWRFAATL